MKTYQIIIKEQTITFKDKKDFEEKFKKLINLGIYYLETKTIKKNENQ